MKLRRREEDLTRQHVSRDIIISRHDSIVGARTNVFQWALGERIREIAHAYAINYPPHEHHRHQTKPH